MTTGRAVQRDRPVARPREHDNDAPICRSRTRDEREGPLTAGGARHQDGPLQGAKLAAAVPANAVTMRRHRRPQWHIAARAGVGNVGASVHSRDVCIAVGRRRPHQSLGRALHRSNGAPWPKLDVLSMRPLSARRVATRALQRCDTGLSPSATPPARAEYLRRWRVRDVA